MKWGSHSGCSRPFRRLGIRRCVLRERGRLKAGCGQNCPPHGAASPPVGDLEPSSDFDDPGVADAVVQGALLLVEPGDDKADEEREAAQDVSEIAAHG